MSGPDKLKIGTSVHHISYGFGIVVQIKKQRVNRHLYLVAFDSGAKVYFGRRDLKIRSKPETKETE